MNDKDKVSYMEGGILTADLLDKATSSLLHTQLKPNVISASPYMIKALDEWQKQEKWLKSLSTAQEKIERLRIRLKTRKPHLPVNLPP